MKLSFATCLNCIDGKTHLPLINWIKDKMDKRHLDRWKNYL